MKPEWSKRVEHHDRMIRAAHLAMQMANQLRCKERDSGGAQCTADAKPEHAHRYHEEDLPGAPTPVCGAPSTTSVMTCTLDRGHDGLHQGRASDGSRRNFR